MGEEGFTAARLFPSAKSSTLLICGAPDYYDSDSAIHRPTMKLLAIPVDFLDQQPHNFCTTIHVGWLVGEIGRGDFGVPFFCVANNQPTRREGNLGHRPQPTDSDAASRQEDKSRGRASRRGRANCFATGSNDDDRVSGFWMDVWILGSATA